jgi:hypothetical protein
MTIITASPYKKELGTGDKKTGLTKMASELNVFGDRRR